MMKINAKTIGIALLCIIAIYGVIILIRKIMHDKSEDQKKLGWKYYMEPYGEIMDEACMNNDCTTEEGKKNATAQCMANLKQSMSNLKRRPGDENSLNNNWKYLESGCTNPDPEIRANACPEPCDPESVADYILRGGKSAATDYTAQSLKALQSMNDLASQSSVSRAVLEQIAQQKKDDLAKQALFQSVRSEDQSDLSSLFDTSETKEYYRRMDRTNMCYGCNCKLRQQPLSCAYCCSPSSFNQYNSNLFNSISNRN